MASLGDLDIDIDLDLSGVEDAISDLRNSLNDLTDDIDDLNNSGDDVGDDMSDSFSGFDDIVDAIPPKIQAVIVAVTAMATAAATATAAVTKMTTAIAHQEKLLSTYADSVNVSRSEFTVFSEQARRMGGDIEDVTDVLQEMNIKQTELKKSSGALFNILSRGGADIQSLTQATGSIEFFVALKKELEQLDPTMRRAAASAALGEDAFKQFGPLLLDSSKSVASLKQELKDLGVVLDTETSQQMAQLDKNIFKLNQRWRAFKKIIAGEVAPVLINVTDGLLKTAAALSDMSQIFGGAEGAVTAISAAFKTLDGVTGGFLSNIAKLPDAIAKTRDNMIEWGLITKETTKDIKDQTSAIERLGNKASEAFRKVRDGASEAAESVSDLISEGLEKMNDHIKDMRSDKITEMETEIVKLENSMIGIEEPLEQAKIEEKINDQRAAIKELRAEWARLAGEVEKAAKLQAEATGLRRRGDQGVADARSGGQETMVFSEREAQQIRNDFNKKQAKRSRQMSGPLADSISMGDDVRSRTQQPKTTQITKEAFKGQNKLAEELTNVSKATNTTIDGIQGITNSISQLKGMSDSTKAALSAVSTGLGALQGVATQLASGNIIGAALTGIGGIISTVGAAQKEKKDGDDIKDFGEEIGKSAGREMRKEIRRLIVIQGDPRRTRTREPRRDGQSFDEVTDRAVRELEDKLSQEENERG